MQSFTIGQLAKQLGISTDTIRFYEKKGLVDKPSRNINGYRCYSENALSRLKLIQQAKLIGFTLKQIDELVTIQLTSHDTCNDVRQQAMQQLANINHRLNELQRLKVKLESLIHKCEASHPANICPFLQALETDNKQICR